MTRLSLAQRLTLVFALLLILCTALTVHIQYKNRTLYSDAMIQNLSRNLASTLSQSGVLMNAQGINPGALKQLFDQMMSYNPSVEVYLLDPQGHLLADAAPAGKVLRKQVDIQPVKAMLNGQSLPVYGDDPRTPDRQKVFSAAPISIAGHPVGYLYVILQGEDYNQLNQSALTLSLQRSLLWMVGIIMVCGLLAGGFAFYSVTSPVRRLTRQVNQLGSQSEQMIVRLAAMPYPTQRDEVALLQRAYIDLAKRISSQWESLALKDQQRREFVANISHDLRTPLMSIQGYLETLSVKAASLTEAERARYLQIALTQSIKVGGLAQQLFELARLEHGVVTPQREHFFLPDLVQDVIQKFELPMAQRLQQLKVDIAAGLPPIDADMSMIERVLTNLIDNAVRHTPDQGQITLHIWAEGQQVLVEVADSGPGISSELRATLFVRPSVIDSSRRDNGGLGLMIVRRMLLLHQGDISLADSATGACFRFFLPLSGHRAV